VSTVEEITSLLAQAAKGDKAQAGIILQSAGFSSWNDVVNSEMKLLRELKSKLIDMVRTEFITITVDDYKITRPKEMMGRSVSDISFTFKGLVIK